MELFGEQAVHDALIRVASTLMAASGSRALEDVSETPLALELYATAVKAEFRRVLKPH